MMIIRRILTSSRSSMKSRLLTTHNVPISSGSEGLLPDGRISLRRAMFGHQSGFAHNWLSDPSTYPILFVMAGALSILTVASVNTLVNEPDVCFSKEKRAKMIPNNYEEGGKWEQGGLKKYLVGKDTSHNSIFAPSKTFHNKDY